MIQTDLPADQVGKVYSLRTILESLGLSLGLLLAVPVFAYLSRSSCNRPVRPRYACDRGY